MAALARSTAQIQLPRGVVPGLHCTAGRTAIVCVGTAAGTIRTTSAGAVPGAIGIISARTVTGAVGVVSIGTVAAVIGIGTISIVSVVGIATILPTVVVAVSTVLVAIVPFIIIVPRIDRRFFLGLGRQHRTVTAAHRADCCHFYDVAGLHFQTFHPPMPLWHLRHR